MQRINFQPLSKIERRDDDSLLVHSIFKTIQGEGPNVGMASVFVRLSGCNLQCPGCDTEYTNGSVYEHIDSIVTRIGMAFGDYPGERLVVVTGGEPFRQSLESFLNLLFERGYSVQIETNGTLGFANMTRISKAVWRGLQIVVSPKAGKVAENIQPFITAYKYVLDANNIDPADGLPECVLGMPGRPARPHDGFEGIVYVQAAEESSSCDFNQGTATTLNSHANKANLNATINMALKFGHRLCLQTHKIVGLD